MGCGCQQGKTRVAPATPKPRVRILLKASKREEDIPLYDSGSLKIEGELCADVVAIIKEDQSLQE